MSCMYIINIILSLYRYIIISLSHDIIIYIYISWYHFIIVSLYHIILWYNSYLNIYIHIVSYSQCIPIKPWDLNGRFIDSCCQQGLELVNSPGIQNSWDAWRRDDGTSIARDGQDRHLGRLRGEKIWKNKWKLPSSIFTNHPCFGVLGYATRKGYHFFFRSPGSEMPLWAHPRTMVLSSMPVSREGPQISCVHGHIRRGSPSLGARQNPRRTGRWNVWAKNQRRIAGKRWHPWTLSNEGKTIGKPWEKAKHSNAWEHHFPYKKKPVCKCTILYPIFKHTNVD